MEDEISLTINPKKFRVDAKTGELCFFGKKRILVLFLA